jgi:hypothetical protein
MEVAVAAAAAVHAVQFVSNIVDIMIQSLYQKLHHVVGASSSLLSPTYALWNEDFYCGSNVVKSKWSSI